jgi:hypothetical protein
MATNQRRLAELELVAAEAEAAARRVAAASLCNPAGAPGGGGVGECILCMDADRRVVLRPCGHLCLCQQCADAVLACDRRCPLCRQEVHEIQVVFT